MNMPSSVGRDELRRSPGEAVPSPIQALFYLAASRRVAIAIRYRMD
jgi:hypothetical protein